MCNFYIFQRKIRQHYYSSVSYTDSRVGLVLEQLDKSGFADDTIIVFMGDHGMSCASMFLKWI